MTRHEFFKVSAIVIALSLAFGFTACGNGTTAKSGEAKLTAITIGGTAVTPLPQPIPSAVWDLEGPLTDLEDDQTAEAVLERDVDLTAIPITFSASSGASVAFGRASGLAKPAATGGGAFAAAPPAYAVPNNLYLYVRVTAEDGTINYYRFHITRKVLVTTLSSLTIGSKSISFSNNNNSSTASYNGMSSAANANLSSGDRTNSTVTAVSSNTEAVIQYAVVKKDVTTDPVFAAGAIFTFDDEDNLYVKITATDSGETETRYYKFLIIIGRDATLQEINFSGELSGEPFSVSPEIMGLPLDSVEAFDELEEDDNETIGKMQFEVRQPLGGFKVNAVPSDEDATVSLSRDGIDFTTENDAAITFNEGDFLYVKVIAGNGIITQYYKIKMVLRRSAIIIYGSPATINAASPDAIWDSTEWMPVNRLNKTEGAAGYNAMPANERTHGQVKLLWDEDGIWVYAQVWEKNVTATAATSDHHMSSSVELFVNEAYANGVKTGAVTGSANNGGQYRLGANGEASGAPDAAVTAMKTLNQYSAYKFSGQASPAETGSILTSGYKVIFHAPWRFPNLYPIKDEKEISMELQINATGNDSRRGGVLNWNNENSNSYNSLKDYGEAVLYLGDSEFKAFAPIINKQPEGQNLMQGESVKALSVTAESIDEGTLSYKWYSNTTDSYTGGTLIGGAPNSAAYTPTVTAIGKYYYWVEITNTKASNGTSKSVNSNRARIYIKDPAVSIPDWVLEFDPPLRNAEAVNNNTRMITIKLDKYAPDGVTVTEEFDVTNYATMSVVVKVYGKDGVTERTLTGSEYSICTYLWRNAEDAELNSADYNVGRPDKPFLNRTIPAAVLSAGGLKTLIIQSGDAFNATGSNALSLGYMEVYKVTFYPPEE